jgi:hypothetical protein
MAEEPAEQPAGAAAIADPRARDLVDFALAELPGMRLADGAFCWDVAAGEKAPRGRSLRYTLICALGLARARGAGRDVPVDPDELMRLVMDEIDAPEITLGDLGLLLWLDSRLGSNSTDAIAFRLHKRIGGGFPDVEGLEVSWALIGASAADAPELCTLGRERQLARASTPSGLVAHTEGGRRARFPNFATQIYSVYALTAAGEIEAAKALADKLIALQRPDGGWPWIYDVRSGRVVEPYEVYSVHQDAMVPMTFFELSEASGEARYREAALRGFEWMFGRNDLSARMIDPKAMIVHRSIRRRRPFDRGVLYANTATALLGRPAFARVTGPLEINRTDRPYHLGWVLEAWTGRG